MINKLKEKWIKMETFVTGFINLSALENNDKRRSPGTYIKHARKLLQKDIYLYLFLEEDLIEAVREEREKNGLLEKTYIKKFSYQELYTYPFFEAVKKNREVNTVVNANGVKDTASYITVVNAKMDLVRQVVKHNPFKSSHFGWVDFGIYHVAIEGGDPFHITVDKMKLQLMEPFSKDKTLSSQQQYRRIQGKISAGYMTGSASYWLSFAKAFYEEMEDAIRNGFGPSEEQIFPVLSIKQPEMFEFYYGKYETILVNYPKQTLFFGLCNYQLKKCERLNLDQGVEMSRYLFEGIEKQEEEDLIHHLSAYLGILFLTYKYHKMKYGKDCEICRRVISHYYLKCRDVRFAFFRHHKPADFSSY